MTDLAKAEKKNFNLFLIGAGFSSFALGVNALLYPWLLVGILGTRPDQTGAAMMALMLPPTFLLLWGGALSDGRPLGSLLLRLYALYAIPLFILLIITNEAQLSYVILLLCGLMIGTINAFVQPARESLLGKVAVPPLQGAVARAMIAQYFGMALGSLIAGNLLPVSLNGVLLIAMVGFFISGALMYLSSASSPPITPRERVTLAQISEGLRIVWKDRLLRNLIAVSTITGLLGLGYYFVLLPLLTREIYQEASFFLAGLQATFLMGGVFCTLVVIRWMPVFKRPGRVLVSSTLLRGALLLAIAMKLPEILLFMAIFAWGVLSGLSTVIGRSLVQQYGPAKYRSRIISIYQLSIFGMAPIGALVGGLLIDRFGVLQATGLLAGVILALAAPYLLRGNVLRDLRSEAAAKSQ